MLDGDIDAATTATWDDGFQPIGTPQAPFSGSLDGRNHTISDLRIHRPFLAGTNQGLFGVVQGGQIRHLSLRNAQVSGYSHTGALVGHLDAAGVLDNVHVDGVVSATLGGNQFIGGLVGSSAGTIRNSSAAVSVSGTSDIGGLAGESSGLVSASQASGTVHGYQRVGGMIGTLQAGGIVRNGIANVATTVDREYGGGLVGINRGRIEDSAAHGEVTHAATTGIDHYVGGLVALNEGEIVRSHAYGDVSITVRPIGDYDHVGGFVALNAAGASITDAGAHGDVHGAATTGGFAAINHGNISRAIATGYVEAIFYSQIANVGGLVGENTGTIEYGRATGNVKTEGNWAVSGETARQRVGGLIGLSSGNVSTSYALGNVHVAFHGNTGYSDAGGLIGHIREHGGLTDSYASGNIHAYRSYYASSGGLVGHIEYGAISQSYALGSATHASTAHVSFGGLLGYRVGSGSTLSRNFWNTGSGAAAGIGSGSVSVTPEQLSGQSLAALKQLSTFSAWDSAISDAGGTSTWRIYPGQTTPLLRGFLTPLTVTAHDDARSADGTPYSGGNGVHYSLAHDPDKLLGTLAYGGNSQGAVVAGAYVIQPQGQYSLQDGYDIAYVPGTLTIGPVANTPGASHPVVANAGLGGVASCTPSSVTNGGTATCVATPDPGYAFVEWTGACAGSGSTCVLDNVTSAKPSTAHFALQITYPVVANAGPGGVASCTPDNVPEGGKATCVATPDPGFAFDGWSGACAGSGSTRVLTGVTGAMHSTAHFVPEITLDDSVFADGFETK